MKTALPQHVAIILDGNGRWAEKRGLSRSDGHRAGMENARPIVNALQDRGVTHTTLYIFSTENWRRPREEVNDILNMLRDVVEREARAMHKAGVIIHHIGAERGIDEGLLKSIHKAVRLTRNNNGMHLGLAFNYGGRAEIIDAVRRTAVAGIAPETLTEESFSQYLYTAGFPDVDLLIRTGGEYRISNFLIWQSAYAEYYFTPVLWPDFDKAELDKALEDYGHRQRRFGGLGGSG